MSALPLDAADVEAAAARLLPHLLPTPLLPSPWLSALAGREVLVKWESQQRTGSFKWRGALHKLLCVADRGAREVLAVSAGNHGLGLAEAARLLGMRATVVVPKNAARTKVDAIIRAGAELLVRGADYDEAEAAARALADERGVEFASPYNDLEVIAGQGTVALEILGAQRVGTLLVPTGGGGLLAGVGVVARARIDARRVRVVGVQPAHAGAMRASLRAGGRVTTAPQRPTLADGLAGNLEPGSITVALAHATVDDVVLVEEAAIEEAMRRFVIHDHQIVEGSGAVGAAALIAGALDEGLFGPGPVVVLVTGRNLDAERLKSVLAGGAP